VKPEQDRWRSDIARSLSALDFPGSPEEWEEKLIIASKAGLDEIARRWLSLS